LPKNINNADAAQALVAAYALKGSVRLELDEMVVPVAIVDDLSPVNRLVELRPCGQDIIRTPVAAEFGYGGCQTQDGFALDVQFFDVFLSDVNAITVQIKLFSAANLTTIGQTIASMVAKDLPRDSNAVGSQSWTGTHTANIGVLLGEYVITGATTTRVPVGVTIYGVDNPNRRSVGLVVPVANRLLHFVAVCVERDDE